MVRPRQIGERAGANLARGFRRLAARAALRPGFWVVVRLRADLDELGRPHLPFGREEGPRLLDVLETLEAAADDPEVDGVLLRIHGSPRGWSVLLSLRRAILRVRERGKPVAAFAESLDAEGLLLASAATRVWLPESGEVFLVGLRVESFYLRGLLDRLALKPEVVRIGRHKTAGEHFTRGSMSAAEREQLESLAEDLFAELVDGIAEGRGLSSDAVRSLIDRGPYHARSAVRAGLVDGCLYPDELEPELEALTPVPPDDRPGPRRVSFVEAPLYHGLRAADTGWRPLLTELPRVAYVVARGGISRGRAGRGIASDSFRKLLERVGHDGEVRGVVLRIDSPGGDALASDLLWRAVTLLRREKPVVVSMGDVAASGGYFMAAAADAVFAEAGSVTGSIGVVGGKLNLEGLYERIGVARDGIERGARAGMLSEARGFTPSERAKVRDTMGALYGVFLDRVAQGRPLAREAVEKVAEGRVWSGARARALGLVDAIGGPLEAIAEARRRAGLRDDERVLIDVHPRLPRLPGLRALLPRRTELL